MLPLLNRTLDVFSINLKNTNLLLEIQYPSLNNSALLCNCLNLLKHANTDYISVIGTESRII